VEARKFNLEWFFEEMETLREAANFDKFRSLKYPLALDIQHYFGFIKPIRFRSNFDGPTTLIFP